ncbi:C40 family peptidase [Desulfobacter postgatei]|uniref:C40 family peptidase n=1 Tax=Desulfobacter postgatei TaxID=2293 RepID=UPI002A37262B|nr:C40 family peptidase [Desulfobacter postgatei]MDX9965109.1 C40 family peptidase [Desulfobacter postgatei]
MPKFTSLIRTIAILFLAVLICFGCGKLKGGRTNQSGLPRQSDDPEYNRSGPLSDTRQSIVQAAMTAVGTPYRWGGVSPKGFDCSGLVVYTHAKIGIHVPRTASAQFKNCTSVSRQNIKPADLVFFSVPRRRGDVHVGIYIGKGQFIHAPGRGRKVKRVSLDNIYFKHHLIKAGNFFKQDEG